MRSTFIISIILLMPLCAQAQVKIIFDTDMDTDCDDAGALAMLHALADLGEAEILATVVSSRFPQSAPCVEAINRYYGRADLPIGAPKTKWAETGRRGSRYARQIAEEFETRLNSNDDAPDAIDVYRRVLAGQPDHSVVIVTVGYITNLRDLLESKADDISPLDGPELVRQKVQRWVCMGGRYPEHLDPHVYGNFKPDPSSAVIAARDWPGPIFFSGEGENVGTGGRLKETPENNPVRRIYELYLGSKKTRPSWDLVAVMIAVRPDAEFWKFRTDGHNHIFENGTNRWVAEDWPNHSLVEFQDEVNIKLRDLFDSLVVRPPKTK